MTSQDIKLRLVVQQWTGEHWVTLDEMKTDYAMRLLGIPRDAGLWKAPLPPVKPNGANEVPTVTGCALKLLATLAEYRDPASAQQLDAATKMNPNTVSSRLSWLKSLGLVDATYGRPSRYWVTDAGRALLDPESSKPLEAPEGALL